jgi:pyridoxamine 5'-phosphate oxidase family protein
MIFTDAERRYLQSQILCRLATSDGNGRLQVRPLGFRLNDDDTIDLGGRNHAATLRYRNVQVNPHVAVVVDDLTPHAGGGVRPGMGRGVEVRGWAETLEVDDPPVNPAAFSRQIIRIHAEHVNSWHIDPDLPDGSARTIRRD